MLGGLLIEMARRISAHRAPLNDDSFVRAFARGQLHADEWDHFSHLRAAWLALGGEPRAVFPREVRPSHVRRSASFLDALGRLRTGIQRLNATHGVDGDGYHETLTIAWLRCVDAARGADCGISSMDFVLRHAELHDKRHLLVHYTRHRIMSPSARQLFVPADRIPLPRGPRWLAASIPALEKACAYH